MSGIDQAQLHFEPGTLQLLNVVLAVIMFGVALDLRPADFARVLRLPMAPFIGLLCQFLLMPALAFLLVLALQPAPSIALGIMLIAACPGGNMSNFLTSLGRGNAALSVSMSAISTLSSIVMTPLNFLFWAGLNPQTRALIQQFEIAPADMVTTVLLILVAPTLLGIGAAHYRPGLAARLVQPMRIFSVLFLAVFIAAAFAANIDNFLLYLGDAFWIVFIVNSAALALGYFAARLARLAPHDARAVAFETGVQNAGFGLLLIFNFFNALGGMALIAAWWGVWHLISGLTLALYWRHSRGPQAAG